MSFPQEFIPKVDYTGRRFGNIIVKEFSHRSKYTYWNCLCDCGNTCILPSYILDNALVSCGCMSSRGKIRINLVGQTYGQLTVIKYAFKRGKHHFWLCECTCGKQKVLNSGAIKNGNTKSCGCLHKKSSSDNAKKLGKSRRFDLVAKAISSVFSEYKQGAKSRGLEFYLTKKDVEIFMHSNCHYCNRPPSNLYKVAKENHLAGSTYPYNGIDRKDSSSGYFLDNCVPCCKLCNRAKMDMGYEEFIEFVLACADHIRKTIIN